MTPNEYMKQAARFDRDYDVITERMASSHHNPRIMLGGLGISGEAGEVADLVKKALIYGKPIDVVELKKECGDVLWYMALLLSEVGGSFEECMDMNIEKLSTRYPNGFNEADAIARKDVK